ncbi:MAG: beta-lactamase family protein [Oscillospiraceae bacterium]|nr:beta-lactamase family protein [Oscillospiraceae bacterium]
MMDFTKVSNFLETLPGAGIPGTDLTIYLKGKEVYRKQTGFTDLEAKTPIAPDTLYPIYSMTKVITCVSAMRLNEEGAFSLNDPLYEYIPEFKNMNVRTVTDNGEVHILPAVNPIKVADLFTMSSGLTYNITPECEKLSKKTKGNYTLKEFAQALSKDPLYFEPGTHWHYGLSHDILGYLIEVITGKTLGKYFEDNIFKPLDMKDTFFRIPKNKEKRLIKCYEYDESSKKHKIQEFQPIRFDLDAKYESGGGGLISTIDDYAKFANALCAGGTASNKYRILSNHTIDLMRTNHLDDVRMQDYKWAHHRGYGYGLGVRTMVDKAAGGSNSNIGEYGWSGMAGTYVLIDPAADLTYVYAQQLIPSKEEYVAPRLRNVIYGCL